MKTIIAIFLIFWGCKNQSSTSSYNIKKQQLAVKVCRDFKSNWLTKVVKEVPPNEVIGDQIYKFLGGEKTAVEVLNLVTPELIKTNTPSNEYIRNLTESCTKDASKDFPSDFLKNLQDEELYCDHQLSLMTLFNTLIYQSNEFSPKTQDLITKKLRTHFKILRDGSDFVILDYLLAISMMQTAVKKELLKEKIRGFTRKTAIQLDEQTEAHFKNIKSLGLDFPKNPKIKPTCNKEGRFFRLEIAAKNQVQETFNLSVQNLVD